MDIRTIKLDLIQWLTDLEDPFILKQLEEIKNGEDWWGQITEEEKEAIDDGLSQLDQGRGIPHEEVMRKARGKWTN